MSTAATEAGSSGSGSLSPVFPIPRLVRKAEEKKPSSGTMAKEKLLPSESQLRGSFNSLSLDPNSLNRRSSTFSPETKELVGFDCFKSPGWDDIKIGDVIPLNPIYWKDDDDLMIYEENMSRKN